MGFKPSARRKIEEEEVNLLLNPMMDMFAVLIPGLLMLSAVVEVAVINVAAPSIGEGGSSAPPPEHPPLNLTVTITDKGYIVAGSGGVLGGTQAAPGEKQGPTIPLVQKAVVCSRFRGTWPPPRSVNKASPVCPKDRPMDQMSFQMYDTAALTRKIVEVKDSFPDERRIIIAAEPDIEYEAIIDVMDATRDVKEKGDEIRPLFDEVVLSPGVF